jgi:hypothetical protein
MSVCTKLLRMTIAMLVTVLSVSPWLSSQEKLGAEERSRIIALADKLEANPLDDSLTAEREWALKRLIEAPDISVPMCPSILGDYNKYKFSSAITTQLLLASASFILKNPESNDRNAVYLAGAESSLRAYQAILRQKPDKKSKQLDELVAKQSEGKLKEVIEQSAGKTCKT